jgi:magnesium-transporting ATPase (P-type)
MLASPFFINGFVIYICNSQYNGREFIYTDEDKHLLWYFQILSGGALFFALLMNFLMLRKKRDKENPHQLSDLYSRAGNFIKFKRMVFVITLIFCFIILPALVLICFCQLISKEGVWSKDGALLIHLSHSAPYLTFWGALTCFAKRILVFLSIDGNGLWREKILKFTSRIMIKTSEKSVRK